MKIKKILIASAFLLFSGCSYKGNDLATVQEEELNILLRLPCELVGKKEPWDVNQHDFLCNMGAWGSITYLFYAGDDGNNRVNEALLTWKQYEKKSFFTEDDKQLKIVLGQLSEQLAPENKMMMLGFASEVNDYTFYTDYLKIKHTAHYNRDTPEPYYTHKIRFQSLKR